MLVHYLHLRLQHIILLLRVACIVRLALQPANFSLEAMLKLL